MKSKLSKVISSVLVVSMLIMPNVAFAAESTPTDDTVTQPRAESRINKAWTFTLANANSSYDCTPGGVIPLVNETVCISLSSTNGAAKSVIVNFGGVSKVVTAGVTEEFSASALREYYILVKPNGTYGEVTLTARTK